MKFSIAFLALAFCLLARGAASEEQPINQVRSTTDRIVQILKSPELQGEPKRTERHRLIRQELENRFDWDSICRSCLGRHWNKLSKQQQSDFIELFKNFLERTYLDRIEPYYDRLERIDYQGQRIVENNYASVKTVVVTKEKIEHPVEYRLERSANAGWRVYDVVIEGVSLAKNYRTQFDEIINRSSFQALIDDLKSKISGNP